MTRKKPQTIDEIAAAKKTANGSGTDEANSIGPALLSRVAFVWIMTSRGSCTEKKKKKKPAATIGGHSTDWDAEDEMANPLAVMRTGSADPNAGDDDQQTIQPIACAPDHTIVSYSR